jgi:Ca2+/H+ antiporter
MTDLFDFFKENEEKLKEAPSSRVWNQLEQKLEHRKRARRKKLFLQIWLVVFTLAILILAAVLVQHFSHVQPK